GLTNNLVVSVASGAFHSLALVNDGSPQILRPPVGGMAWSGRDFTLQATAVGTAQLNYQWQFNGQNIDGATNATLALPAIQSSSAGNYTITVSNLIGAVTSIPAVVSVTDSK